MWTWFARFAHSSCPAAPVRTTPPSPSRVLALEWLEAREVPALTIQLDYSFDANGFFSDPGRRAVMQQAATDLGSRITTPLSALGSSGVNTWTATFFDPSTGQQASVKNPTIPANTIVVYVGGRAIGGSEAGFGGYGGYSATGYQAWFDQIRTRGHSGFALWGGSVAFDTTTNWHVGMTTSGLDRNEVDLYSVAVHELGHVLGIGTAPQWFNQVSGVTFTGGAARGVFGTNVPVYAGDHAHWDDGLRHNGQPAAMDPILQMGTRVTFSSLDFAGLADLGWAVTGINAPTTPPTTTIPPTTNPAAGNPVVLTGPADGSAQLFTLGANGTLAASSGRFVPFPGFAGVIRSVVADFNGDGVLDTAYGTGAGPAARVRVTDGKTGGDLAGPTNVLDGFGGGVFLAAGDVDRDGRAELAVSADAGGGTRVSLYKVAGGGLTRTADFLAFGDANFRGGSRVALGDVNRDGAADLIVGAGIGGAPRVAVYSGAALAAGTAARLIPDFFALDPALRSGVFVTAGDLNGDGHADAIYSTGDTGGPRVRVVSGAVLAANPGQDAYYLPALADFFALDPADRNGLRLAARDLNKDGRAELIAASGDETRAQVRVITLPEMTSPAGPTGAITNPFGDPATIDGVYVG